MATPELLLIISTFVLLLLASALFSGSETAFFSLSETDKASFDEERVNDSGLVRFLLQRPESVLTTIVLSNTLVNIAIASLAAYITHDIAGQSSLPPQIVYLIDIFAVTVVILIVSEILPKVFAVRRNVTLLKRTGAIIWSVYWLFYPVTYLVNRFVGDFAGRLRRKYEKPMFSDSELKTLMEFGEASGDLDADEKEMITSIFEFGETTAREIIVPRTDMVAHNIRESFAALTSLIKKKHFSRIPVFEENIDNIIGILYVKDLLPLLVDEKKDVSIDLRSLLRPAYFVPEQKNIDELLKEFQTEKIHIAIVVDEYGGTAGLVTLEDVLEEIVGEIQDEFDEEKPLILPRGENNWLISAKTPLEDIEEELAIEFPSTEDVETLGGLILAQLGAVPQEGARVICGPLRCQILRVTKQRIIEVQVSIGVPDESSN
jgi:putative hemolysin